MNFKSLDDFNWISFNQQNDCNVTYVFVSETAIARLSGKSDILYIGKTEQPISKRYNQETNTNNTPKNTQLTNIRLTHIFSTIGLNNYKCYYFPALKYSLKDAEKERFISSLKIWNKSYYLNEIVQCVHQNKDITVELEKYLLVNYAHEHLELPPLNGKF